MQMQRSSNFLWNIIIYVIKYHNYSAGETSACLFPYFIKSR